jgi:REP element-mobilizing transposase RayT
MPRPLRPQIEDGIYHVTSRGNRKQAIYVDAADRQYFLQLAGRNRERYGWLVHTYCLMTNHFHLLVETPQPKISAAMQRLNSMYAEWFNWRHRFSGHLFQGRFHSASVGTDSHFMEACRYIVLNPIRAGICDDPREYQWSSYRATAALEPPPDLLTLDMIVELFGGRVDVAPKLYAAFVAAGINDAIRVRTAHVPGLTPALAA